MSNVQTEATESKPTVPNIKDLSIGQFYEVNEKIFKNLYKKLYSELNGSDVSKKNALRGIFAAIAVDVDPSIAPTLSPNDGDRELEKQIGSYFAQLLEKWLVVLSRKMEAKAEEERAEFEIKKAEQEQQLNTENLNDKGEQ